MPLLTESPVVPLTISTARTHQLRIGAEVVQRDGASAFVSEVSAADERMVVQLTNGQTHRARRGRRWRVRAQLTHLVQQGLVATGGEPVGEWR